MPSVGPNLRSAQLATWKPAVGLAVAPSSPARAVCTERGSELVGLTVNPLRSRLTWIERSLSGTPPTIEGRGSEATVTWAESGSTLTAALTTTLPRSYGPSTAGVTTTKLSGAP